ncbi:MAG TPA: hypothetical protein VFR49_16325, partial [Solirubrobacteraceae bacterium]|nr:hypothetical protein [Solirubrobacteraceae bacterium]
MTRARKIVCLGGLAVLLSACGSARTGAPPPPVAPPAEVPAVTGDSLVAQARGLAVAVFHRPGAARATLSLASPNPYGFRRVLLVKRA